MVHYSLHVWIQAASLLQLLYWECGLVSKKGMNVTVDLL